MKRVVNDKNSINFEEINLNELKDNNQVFLKIDIEGSEYEILDQIVSIKKKIQGIVIEFHEVTSNLDKIESFLKAIEDDLKLVHIHANNWSTQGLDDIPSSIELSFSKKPVLLNNNITFPHNLDQKNNPDADEIKLVFS